MFLGLLLFTYTGQMLVSLVRDAETAQNIGTLLVTTSVLFSGVLIRPSEIPTFWIFAYWCFPGHYIMEGIFMTQYDGDDTPIQAQPGSPFYNSLPQCQDLQPGEICEGTAEQWIQASFTDFDRDHIPYGIAYLVSFIVVTRLLAFYALTNLNYRST